MTGCVDGQVRFWDAATHAPAGALMSSGGPFTANKPMYLIQLSEGKFLNAGGLLSSYYYGGRGVTAMSDTHLTRSIETA